MMRRRFLSALVMLSLVAGVSTAIAGYHSPRQYYSGWHKPAAKSYYYRVYYYKPVTTYVGYRHHYVIYHPQRPKHYYYYNPVKRVYWGRCPVEQTGAAQYSLLAEKDRKGNLEDIPESAFPKPGRMPSVPDSEDLELDLPPSDLPADLPATTTLP